MAQAEAATEAQVEQVSAEKVLAGKTPDAQAQAGRIGWHAWFALLVLMLANLFNYVDRYILSILAQAIKADLRLDDAQLGFLLGTAFAVFYAVVGIAMGRIADRLSRKKLMAFGLALWSGMTALGGMATSFAGLAAARIGVGIGEATASPCSHALLAEIFPARRRAMALAVYLSGTYAGSALALIAGGYILQHWGSMCQTAALPGLCGLAGWQAALFAVGLPGLLLALVLLRIREPTRARGQQAGAQDGTARIVAYELSAALPPMTLFSVAKLGGSRELILNLAIAGAALAGAAMLAWLTGDASQWFAIGLGAYAVVTWAQVQRLRDRPLFALTFGDRTFLLSMFGSALLACIGGAVSVWAAPYLMRTMGIAPAKVGLMLGMIHAASAMTGVIAGGWLADRLKRRDSRAPIFVALVSLLGEIPFLAGMLLAGDLTTFLVAFAGFAFFSSLWGGAFAALTQDLVLPRMRGAAASAFSLFSIVVSSGIGPYWAGKVSAVTGSLQAGLFSMMLIVPAAVAVFAAVLPLVRTATPESRRERARLAGEPI